MNQKIILLNLFPHLPELNELNDGGCSCLVLVKEVPNVSTSEQKNVTTCEMVLQRYLWIFYEILPKILEFW